MKTKTITTSLIASIALLSSTMLTAAEEPDLRGDRQVSRATVKQILDTALPQWDRSLLKAGSDAYPVGQISFDILTEVMGDMPFREKPPEGATQMEEGNRYAKVDFKDGKVRYVNRTRAWNYDLHAGKEPVPESQAEGLALEALINLGFPAEEIRNSIVRTQMAGGAKAGEKTMTELNAMYRLIFVNREINELPVYGDGARVAVSPEGQIQRLGVNWSEFHIPAELKMRSRRSVIKQAMDEIMTQDPDSEMKVEAHLAYAEVNEGSFKPVAVLSVHSKPTPYQVVVDLSTLADEHDKD